MHRGCFELVSGHRPLSYRKRKSAWSSQGGTDKSTDGKKKRKKLKRVEISRGYIVQIIYIKNGQDIVNYFCSVSAGKTKTILVSKMMSRKSVRRLAKETNS